MQTKSSFYFALVFSVVCLVLATGYFIQNQKLKKELAEAKKAAEIGQTQASETQNAENSKKEKRKDAEKLFKELAEVKKRLRDKENELEILRNSTPGEKRNEDIRTAPPDWRSQNEDGDRRRETFSERMERLRTENPERFQEIRQRFSEMTQRIENGYIERQDFLSSLDTSRMNEVELENHRKIEEIVKRNAEIAAMLNQNPDSPEAEAARSEMFSNFRELRELFDTERDYALKQFARSLGYTDNGADTFTEYVNYIMRMTSMRSYFPQGMMGPPGRDGDRDR